MSSLLGLVRRLGAAASVAETAAMVTEGVVEVLGFGACATSLVGTDGSLRVEAVAGPPDLAQRLLGSVVAREVWDRALAACTPAGGLHWLPAERQIGLEDLPAWTPPTAVAAVPIPFSPAGWRSEDGLLVPLGAADGGLLGVLSVDRPLDGRGCDAEQLSLLELFAAEAAGALADTARSAPLRDREVVFRRVFFDAPVPMVVVDADLGVLWANAAFGALVGSQRSASGVADLSSIVAPDDLGTFLAAAARATGGADPTSVEHRLLRQDLHQRWVRSSLSAIDTEAGGRRLVVRMEDVTDDRRILEELRRLADHDALTGLPNRRLARHHLQRLLDERDERTLVAVLYCDLDGFKRVNDGLGHSAGDDLLALAASRLARVIRPPDMLCRQGGDEFVVVAAMPTGSRPEAIAQRCIDALLAPFALPSGPITVSVSVGIAAAGARTVSADELLREADAALYRAKDSGRGRWSYLVDEH